MNIIIVGMGVVGRILAEQLSGRNNRISVIEADAALCKEINNKLDVFTVTGSGSDPTLLKNAGVEKAGMLIAVTPTDETNLLICHFAKQFGVPKRIARVSSSEYTRPDSGVSLETLGVTHVIEPEKEVVKSILQHIELPGVTQTANFQSDTIYLRGYRITSKMPLADKTLREIDKIPGYLPMLVVAIVRDGHAVLPTGDARLLPGDEMIAMMPKESLPGFKELVRRDDTILQKVMVFGDSLTAAHLVEALKKQPVERVVLVDPNEEHGREMAGELDGVEVLHGDCTSEDVLQEIHVDNVDFFIAAVEDSEDNVMAALLAKAEGAKEVLAIRDDSRHQELFESLGVDHIINPKKITAEKIIESIHILSISSLFRLRNIDLEVTHFKAERNSRIAGKPLHKLGKLFRKAIVISGVVRDGRLIIPNGDTVINENDDVLVLCAHENIGVVARLFRTGMGL